VPRRVPKFTQLTTGFLDFSARVDLPPVVPPEEDDNAGTCIICVGSTGTGKSSTIAKFTGAQFDIVCCLSSSFAWKKIYKDDHFLLTLELALTPSILLADIGKSLPDTQREKQTKRAGREVAFIASWTDGKMGVEPILESPNSGFFLNLVLIWKKFKPLQGEHKCL
jgi:hypothetical protein